MAEVAGASQGTPGGAPGSSPGGAAKAGRASEGAAGLEIQRDGAEIFLRLTGDWTTQSISRCGAELGRLAAAVQRQEDQRQEEGRREEGQQQEPRRAQIDLSALARLDSAGAWLVWRTRQQLTEAGLEVTLVGGTPARVTLIAKTGQRQPPVPLERQGRLVVMVAHLGWSTLRALGTARELLGFLGLTVTVLARCLLQPRRLRFTSFLVHVERTGLDALPIVGLLAFLIGVVLAYQGADQLARFGAEIFTVNLVGIAVLREMGILITAIVVAGRSGSAYTAQIGTMKVNEEVDAMRTIGLDPMEVLVVPRVLALMVTLPLLTFYADILGIFGGAVMAWAVLDIDFPLFAQRLNEAVTPTAFWIGMIKAPIFAFVIALVGCFEGLKVTSNAESVGTHTTRAVVEAIFLVIVLDALFSVFFSVIGL